MTTEGKSEYLALIKTLLSSCKFVVIKLSKGAKKMGKNPQDVQMFKPATGQVTAVLVRLCCPQTRLHATVNYFEKLLPPTHPPTLSIQL